MDDEVSRTFGTALVGFGPAGLAVLQSAQRAGRLGELLGRGLLVLQQDSSAGVGAIGRYAINSDSTGVTFLDSLLRSQDPVSQSILKSSVAQRIRKAGHNAIPLRDAGELLGLIGQSMRKVIENCSRSRICVGFEVEGAQQTENGWLLTARQSNGQKHTYKASRLILATGASQPRSRLEREYVAHVPLAKRWGDRLVQSDEVLSGDGLERLGRFLRGKTEPKVAILGGSTSAMSVGHALLHRLGGVRFGTNGITLFHRRPLRIYYTSRQAALDDGYTNFSEDDICPLTDRVYRLAGFRLDSRELLMGLLGVGGRPAEPRMSLHRLQNPDHEAVRLIDRADVAIAAFGYRPKALPLFTQAGNRIVSFAETGPSAPLVDEECRVLDANRLPIDGVFAIGLAAGFVPRGRLGGEPSFTGQANGLWLWQTDVGAMLIDHVLQPPSGATGPKETDYLPLPGDLRLNEQAVGV